VIYLDWNATAPPLPEVLDAMRAAGERGWGNPSSIHAQGRAARTFVEDARAAVGALAGADARDVTLTGGGTEANNLAIRSAFEAEQAGPGGTGAGVGVLVTSRLEHPSVAKVAEALEREGRARVRWLAVREDGTIDLADLDRALEDDAVRLVAVQAVNGETGVIQPLAEILARTGKHPRNPRVHVDAVQAFGKLTSLEVLGQADTLALAAHKFRGPKSIGALVARPGVKLRPVVLGGSQERGLRPGTVDPIGAAGLAAAARHAAAGAVRYAALAPLRDRLEAHLLRLGASRVGTGPRVAGVSNLSFPGWLGAELVAALDLDGLCVSSGSACSAGTVEPSPTVSAMLGAKVATSCVRFSMGEDTTAAELEEALAIVTRVLGRQP
jgi:cysteine desulfurase